jgi:ATP-dependent 26S proteasome regulatory subunit
MEDVDASSHIVQARTCAQTQHDAAVNDIHNTNDDTLDLAGLLNALDGVADSPGRIVIMTTNHPENLDPALIRPGRINISIQLNYMMHAEIVEMIEHYFGQGCCNSLEIPDLQNFSPAELEDMCIQAENATQLLELLVAYAQGKGMKNAA